LAAVVSEDDHNGDPWQRGLSHPSGAIDRYSIFPFFHPPAEWTPELPLPARQTSLFQPACRSEAPIGVTPLYKKQLRLFLQIFNILRKKREINFKIGGIG
jgi:hypothetical protein